ncbi:MAG TPA: CRTAC1 family protein, partial [Candidatus Eremiobacteraceae bacterium]|nr:CRTAC1 family protein [Candidatus Eremiobacteraceae bacterium]
GSLAFCLVVISMAAILLVAMPAATQTQNSSAATPPEFTDLTTASGIHFTHFKGNDGVSINLEEFGPGVCVSDYDKDGWQDIYFVNGRDRYNRGIAAKNALYHNNGNGTFTDVTDAAGVPGTNYGLGCVWGDYDNDGFPDLFVTQFGANVLYHNNGDGSFTDVTAKAGVAGLEAGEFHSGAVFLDYDRDGKLDLYVGSYVALGPKAQRYCDIGGIKSSCAPAVYPGSPNALYHNNGNGTFTNVTVAAKILQPNGKNLSVGAYDWDNDGWPDLFVANDGQPAYLYENLHNGKFRETAELAGMAYNTHGQMMASMCISLGDFNNDGWLDLYISDFQKNSDHVWRNSGKGYFDEVSDEAGITLATKDVLSFGGGFFDYDNDGWLDIFIGNGHVYPEIEQVTADTLYKQHNSLFHNEKNGKFSEVSAQGGLNSLPPRAARGVAFADFDNDGYIDVLVANNGDPPTLLHNNALHKNHFVNFKLVGTKSNRDALGARIRVTANDINQIREIAGGGSYLSQSDLRANFGLGNATTISTVEITWPSGAHQTFQNVAADHFYQVTEGRPQLSQLPINKL